MSVLNWIIGNYELILGNAVVIITAIIVICQIIPGEQPEKTLQKIVDFIKKFSFKKK